MGMRRRSVPSLQDLSALTICRLVTKTVLDNSPYPISKAASDVARDEFKEKAFEQISAIISEYFASNAPISILTQLAYVHLPKAVWTTEWKDPAQEQRLAVSGTSRRVTERVGEPFDTLMARALAVLAPFIKAGVSALSLSDEYYRDDADWSFRNVWESEPLKVAYPCSLLVACLADENAMGGLVELDLGKLDAAFFLDYNRLLKAVAEHGKLLKRLILVDTRNSRMYD